MNRKNGMNYLSRVLLIAAGLLCVFHAPYITKWFPYLIGSVMCFAGVTMLMDTYPVIRREMDDKEKYSSRLTRSILLLMLGAITVFKRADSMPFIGVMWGLLGLLKGGRGITVFLCSSGKNKKSRIILGKAVIGIGLSCLLLFTPVSAVGKHISLLGLQIIVYALFKMDPEKRPQEMVSDIHERVDEIAQISRSKK